MMRSVVLVYPRHTHGWEAQPWVDMPMGLLCVASPLDRAGYRVSIIDQRVERGWRERLAEEVRQNPLCVGISTSTGPQLRYALEISELVKSLGQVPVVWGGVHASLLPEETLQNATVDVVVQGEGEETFLELVGALEGGRPIAAVPGIWYKDGRQIRSTGIRDHVDLDAQPPLAYHLLDLKPYRRKVFGTERLSFFTSRGCPHGCTFCFNTTFNRRRWRSMSPRTAVDRLIHFVEHHELGGVVLYDSNFFADLERARGILRELEKRDRRILITRLHTRADTLQRLDEADFDLLTRVGCKCLSIGIESGSERMQELLGKRISLPGLLEANRRLSRYPLTPLYFFMMGFPTETKEDLRATVDLATTLRRDNPQVDLSFNIYTPFPGTELFDLAVEHGLQPPTRTEQWAEFNYRNLARNAPWLTDEMKSLVRMLDFCGLFLGMKYTQPYKETRSLALFVTRLYAPIARLRAQHLFHHLPVEIHFAKQLRLYGRQD